jgi:hypothetical protein
MAKQIDKLPNFQTGELKFDPHVHGYTNCRPKARFIEPGFRDLVSLTQQVIENKINAIGITNFTDWNYEFWTSQVKDLPNGWGYYQGKRLTLVLTPIIIPVLYFKAQEIPTKQGHVSVIGGRRGINLPSGLTLDETLDEADKDPFLIKGADHLKSWLAPGLKKNIRGREGRFHGYEWNSSVDGNEDTELQAEKDGVAVYAATDSHWPTHIGRAHTIYEMLDLDFSNENDLVYSIQQLTKQGKFRTQKQEIHLYFSGRHMVLNYGIYLPLKIINSPIVDPNFGKPE